MSTQVPPPDELKKKTSPTQLFKKFEEFEAFGHRFRIRRMTLAEELEWYSERDKILAENGVSQAEKLAKIWERLLQRVVESPRLENYVEELPTPVLARLIQAITELHLWNMDFRSSPQA
ncbi:MAG: hypothetical protein QXN23_03550 [Candidatus Caldarchaeum sp.]|uniref:Uncharacterized protein n=1 Tax=Caldiarchaeum subterraneum TaxID=311458 RepID=A0A7C4I394_CALS0|nr:hypothetical protein [Candidatus Caldarchaeales archaeon]MDJ0272169.1 hypothetical protein [Candidatus Caldarchaeales archaeon]